MIYSLVIVARNEADYLPALLDSVAGCDDIVLIDDGSTDTTVAIAERYGARIFHRAMNNNFASQKNYAIDQAHHDWVLLLDADERLTPELKAVIEALEPKPGTSAYRFPWRNYLGSKWLRHGGLYPDPHTRLFNRHRAHYGEREIHEELEVKGAIELLDHDIIHLTYRNVGAYYKKVVRYATLEASWTPQRPRLRSAVKEFLVRYIKLEGYKDGWAGLESAILLGYYRVIVWRMMGR